MALDRVNFYNLYDLIDAKKHRKYIFKFNEIQRKLKFKRYYSKKAPQLYGGEAWWSLSRKLLIYVLDYTNKNKYLFNRLKFGFCSGEIYFHSILMNSPYNNLIVNKSMRYIDWKRRNGNTPANLDFNDYEKLVKSEALFARKFELPVSDELKVKLMNTLTNEL